MTRGTLLTTTALLAILAAQSAPAPAKDALVFTPIAAPADDATKRAVTASPEVTVDGARGGDRLPDLAADRPDGRARACSARSSTSRASRSSARTVRPWSRRRPTSPRSWRRTGSSTSSPISRPARPPSTSPRSSRPTTACCPRSTPRRSTSRPTGACGCPCAGSVTPWGTHLGSEEYEPDAAKVEGASSVTELKKLDEDPTAMAMYFGFDPTKDDIAAFSKVFNPYAYGYITEIAIGDDGKASGGQALRHGPVRARARQGDAGPEDGLPVRRRHQCRPLPLRGRRARQARCRDALCRQVDTRPAPTMAAPPTSSWVDLGHADSASVKALVAKGTKFSDIFATATMADDGTCPDGFGGSVANGAKECLKVKDGMELAASRLETRRYAALAGCHGRVAQGGRRHLRRRSQPALRGDLRDLRAAWRTRRPRARRARKYDGGGSNDIKLAYNPCGGVYALDLDQDYVATTMKAIVVGKPQHLSRGRLRVGRQYLRHGRDRQPRQHLLPARPRHAVHRRGHQAAATRTTRCGRYNLATGELTRILTTPYGAETTSVYAYPDVNGHGYVMAVVQHPYGESDEDKLQSPGPGPGLSRLYRPVPQARLTAARC